MYIDSSRQAVLARLDREMNDPSKPNFHRRKAWKAKQRIISQLKDRRITRERERLIKAYANNDQYEAWKITNVIKNLNKEELVEDWR